MTVELTDLDVAVINALSARYSNCGEAAFDEAASRLVVAVCALLAHTRGEARLRDLIKLVEAVNATGGGSGPVAYCTNHAATASAAWRCSPPSVAPRRTLNCQNRQDRDTDG